MMLGSGRRLLKADGGNDEVSSGSSAVEEDKGPTTNLEDDSEDNMEESWVDWIQRVTRDIEQKLDKANVEEWTTLRRRRLWRWAGHVARRTDHRWSTTVLNWTPQGGAKQQQTGRGRAQSRPKRRWEDELDEFWEKKGASQGFWRVFAGNREEWAACKDEFSKHI